MRCGVLWSPKAVINCESRCVHLINQGSCFDEDPARWSTKCCWTWIRAFNNTRPLFDDDGLEAVDAFKRGKCFA